ncbi:MAG: UbiX family flavin prenyltransferase [Burkholderiaceae bacterium]|jgi:4-hydroxy-3-polyprenylbenzoate decarboxylase|nr:UbiX family flavin prenyltransferase [Burkholderiaceae bacterium]MEB2319003.1 UbiX family flavin prenyltransferase [Pseudomonadota bacterium]
MSRKTIVLAITGASGACYGIRLLERLREQADVAVHLVVTPAGWMNIDHELGLGRDEVEALADEVHPARDIGASIASGSFPTAGMIVAPCSMRSLAGIAHGLSDNLVTRAADVTLKERRRLVLMVRETPLNLAHLRNMCSVTEMGGIVFPPVPGFYNRPADIAALIDDTCGRALDLLGIETPSAPRWRGLSTERNPGGTP